MARFIGIAHRIVGKPCYKQRVGSVRADYASPELPRQANDQSQHTESSWLCVAERLSSELSVSMSESLSLQAEMVCPRVSLLSKIWLFCCPSTLARIGVRNVPESRGMAECAPILWNPNVDPLLSPRRQTSIRPSNHQTR